MLRVGERAPEFTLPDQSGRDPSLSRFLGPGALILYFYWGGFKPKCMSQACALRDLHSEVEGADGPLGIGIRRATILIDASRRKRDAVSAEFRISRHTELVRKAIMLRWNAR